MVATPKFFCTNLAWEYGIPLVGTATRGDVWFLLEYTGRWGAKALEESTLVQPVKDYINAVRHPGMEVRVLLLKQDQSRQRQGYHFFVGQTHPLEPRLYEYQLQDYVDLLGIDLSSLAAGQAGDPGHLRPEPLYLVCANGKRDQCCSIYGPETYRAMAAEAGEAVWQSSHIGGHNQAPIMLFFPHGLNYAHATPSESRRLIRATRQDEVVLHHYRGRVCFEPPAQAAEHFWREQTGILKLPGVQMESIERIWEDRWNVTLSDTVGKNRIQMQILRQISDFEIPITCTKKKTAPLSSFHRLG